MEEGQEPGFESFISDPGTSAERCNAFKKEVEEELRKRALSVESNLENSVASGGELRPDIIFFTQGYHHDDPYRLMSDSLQIASEIYRTDVKEVIEKAEQEAGSFQAAKVVGQVRQYLEEGVKEGYSERISPDSKGKYFHGKNVAVIKRIHSGFLAGRNLPELLRPLLKLAEVEEAREVNEILVHEMTHAWLNAKSSNYRLDPIPEALNEIFAYHVSYLLGREKFENTSSDLYQRPRLIRWGVKILVEKTEELRERGMKKTGIDFSRELQLRIYEASVSEKEAHYKAFIRFCLLREDKRRLQEFRKLDRKIEGDIARIKNTIFGDAKTLLRDGEKIKELSRLQRKITWENPEAMEEEILDSITERAVNGQYGDLKWMNHQITAELEKRLKMLEKYFEALEIAERSIEDTEMEQDLEKSRNELERLHEELQEVISRGNIQDQRLDRYRDVVPDPL